MTRREKKLVGQLLEYIDSKNCAFVIGNFNVMSGNDYNSAFLFVPGKNVIPPEPMHYEKRHLVPITEYFPFEKQFPFIYQKILSGDIHLWTPGENDIVFEHDGLKFSTPICFEDTFGLDCRRFVRNGAAAFVNLSNDAWSKSKRCQIQHLQMAVFRSVENHVPTVRSTASGETCIINSYGKITERCKPFSESYVIGKIPKLKNP